MSLVERWISPMRSICTVGCCPALERKEILTHATWMNLEDIMLSGISQSQRDKYLRICLCEVPGAVNITETESGRWVPGAGGRGHWGAVSWGQMVVAAAHHSECT